MPATRTLFNNPYPGIPAVAEAMLEDEPSYRKGDNDEAEAVYRADLGFDDTLACGRRDPLLVLLPGEIKKFGGRADRIRCSGG